MSTFLRNQTDIGDFIRGCTFFGVGGGGNPLLGIKRMKEVLDKNGVVKLVDPLDIADDEWTCCVFGMGSIAPIPDRPGAFEQFEKETQDPNIKALEELEEMTGRHISAVVAFEPGGVNTSIGLHAGAMLGRKIVDGDYSGRAVPELCQTGPVIYGENITPVAICDDWGNVIHVVKTASSSSLEGIGKGISVITKAPDKFAICAHAGMMLPGKEMKKYIIPNTLTKALEVGRIIRQSREQGKDAAEEAAKAVEGKVLFKGTVTSLEYESTGYMIGESKIEGLDDYADKQMVIWFKNENHLAKVDEKVVATSPDIIEVVDIASGEPITNSTISVGNRVAVIGAPHKAYRTKEALARIEPRSFGFDRDYIEIEKLW